MFNFKKSPPVAKQTKMIPDGVKTIPAKPFEEITDLDLLKKQVADQEQIIRELVTTVTFIANHKRFEHIQEKLVNIHNLLDKLQKL